MTTNEQLNDTHGYHIKPTNSTGITISCFGLKALCLSVGGKTFFLSAQSNFNYCRKVLSMKNILINIKNKKCTPKSVLRWEFASVYMYYTPLISSLKIKKHKGMRFGGSVHFNIT